MVAVNIFGIPINFFDLLGMIIGVLAGIVILAYLYLELIEKEES